MTLTYTKNIHFYEGANKGHTPLVHAHYLFLLSRIVAEQRYPAHATPDQRFTALNCNYPSLGGYISVTMSMGTSDETGIWLGTSRLHVVSST